MFYNNNSLGHNSQNILLFLDKMKSHSTLGRMTMDTMINIFFNHSHDAMIETLWIKRRNEYWVVNINSQYHNIG